MSPTGFATIPESDGSNDFADSDEDLPKKERKEKDNKKMIEEVGLVASRS